MSLDLDGALWRFALAFYRRPGVAEACLTLQDEAGIDVVQLIAVIYADSRLAAPLSREEIAALDRTTAGWRREIVHPLRGLRRFLKPARPGFPEEREPLRDKIKAAELMAEQIQLAMIDDWLRARTAGPGLPRDEALAALIALAPARDAADRLAIAAACATLVAAWTAQAAPAS